LSVETLSVVHVSIVHLSIVSLSKIPLSHCSPLSHCPNFPKSHCPIVHCPLGLFSHFHCPNVPLSIAPWSTVRLSIVPWSLCPIVYCTAVQLTRPFAADSKSQTSFFVAGARWVLEHGGDSAVGNAGFIISKSKVRSSPTDLF
jgi:hypothetical protein